MNHNELNRPINHMCLLNQDHWRIYLDKVHKNNLEECFDSAKLLKIFHNILTQEKVLAIMTVLDL